MKKKLSDMGSRNTIPEYVCHTCGTNYSVYDFDWLLCPADGNIYCEKLNCKGEVVESDKLASGEMGIGDDDAIRRCEKLKGMLQKMEEQLKPLQEQLDRVRDLSVPDFGTLQDWEIKVHTAARTNGDSISNESSKSSWGHGGTTMPYFGETGVEVDLVGIKIREKPTEDIKPTTQKVLPPWMIKEGMNLTKEQRGEAKTESNLDHNLIHVEEKKPNVDTEDKKSIQEAFAREYYASLIKRQEEVAARRCDNVLKAVVEDSSERQVGMKSKWENNDNDNIEWEEALAAGKSNTSPSFKRAAHSDLESEDDEIEWVDG